MTRLQKENNKQTKTKCKSLTPSGKRCNRLANKSGFCTLHEQKDQQVLQESKYNEVLELALKTCSTKGWHAYLASDDDEFQMLTVNVSKQFDSQEVTGDLNITVNDGVKYSIEKTSFQAYGLSDLLNSLTLKFDKVAWLETDVDKKKKQQPKEPQFDIVISKLLRNFDRAVRQLKRRYSEREPLQIADEYDTQDFLHALLRAYFDDVRPEEYTPSYAGSASRVDFLLKSEKCVVEVKFATKKLKSKTIGEQLIVDIKRYQSHPDCNRLYCLVYDPESTIHNPIGFENDLSGKHGELEVKVYIVPN